METLTEITEENGCVHCGEALAVMDDLLGNRSCAACEALCGCCLRAPGTSRLAIVRLCDGCWGDHARLARVFVPSLCHQLGVATKEQPATDGRAA